MTVALAEMKLGKVIRVFISEIESREFAEFTKKPKGLIFRIAGGNDTGEAGIYPNGKRESRQFAPKTIIMSIQVSR